MAWKGFPVLKSFTRAWIFRSRMERDMSREMAFHLAARAADLETQGLSRADAARRARSEFGDEVRWKEASRDARGLRLVDDLAADLRYAFRMMRRAPGFTAAAVISLTLGIGATTAIFGLMDLLILRPLPVSNPQELVHITTSGERGDAHSGSSNYPWFREVASRTDLFSDAMQVRHDVYKVGIGGLVEPITGARVSTNYYNLLGVSPILGRTFVPGDSTGPPIAVISYGLWQRRFAGATDVIGTSITVDQLPYTIVGVTPAHFRGLVVGSTMDLTMPLDPTAYADPTSWGTVPVIARVRPGVDIARIGAQLDPMLRRFVGTGVSERFARRYLQRVAVAPASNGISDLRVMFARPLRLLMLAVTLLLLIACVNLAGLLVARNSARQHELGMRLALGAAPSRIMRQLLTESALLALAGAIPGVLLAIRGSHLIVDLMPRYFGPVSLRVAADWRVLSFALAATLVTTFLFGLIPAWQAAHVGVSPGMNRTSTRTATARTHAGRVLVVAQFALSFVLVAGAVLCVRTMLNLWHVDVGFDRDHILVVEIDPQGTSYEEEKLRAFQRDMLSALAALPGVKHVTLATTSPFNGNFDGKRLTVPGFVPRDPDDSVIQTNMVGPDYFNTLQVPILSGRPIEAGDREGTARVAVVSETFGRRYFGDPGAAVGRQFTTGGGKAAITHQIVGVASEVRYQTLRTPSERLIYIPWFQAREVRAAPFDFVISTDGNPANWMNMTRAEMQRLRPDAPIVSIRTMSGVINDRLLSERLLATLGTFFAIVALVLAAVGVFGLQAHVVARRVPEIGVRLALGARPIQMLWMTVRENLLLAAIASGLGMAIALASLRVLEGLLFGLAPTDAVNLAGAALVLVLVSLAAAIVPGRRAAGVDPLVALRYE